MDSSQNLIEEFVANHHNSKENDQIKLNCNLCQINCLEIKRLLNNTSTEILEEKINFNKRLDNNIGNRTDLNQVALPINSPLLSNNRLEINLDNRDSPINIELPIIKPLQSNFDGKPKKITLENKLILLKFLNDHGTARLSKYHINELSLKTKLYPLQCYDWIKREKRKIKQNLIKNSS